MKLRHAETRLHHLSRIFPTAFCQPGCSESNRVPLIIQSTLPESPLQTRLLRANVRRLCLSNGSLLRSATLAFGGPILHLLFGAFIFSFDDTRIASLLGVALR
jgi:hypothetical protein